MIMMKKNIVRRWKDMKEENVFLLKKIYENSKTAVDAFKMIKKRCDSVDFNEFIDKQTFKYFSIAEDANMRLKELNCLPDDMDIWSKLGLITTVKWGNKRPRYFARILIEGCVGGVNEMIGQTRYYERMDSDCLDLAYILIETEQETISILQRFL